MNRNTHTPAFFLVRSGINKYAILILLPAGFRNLSQISLSLLAARAPSLSLALSLILSRSLSRFHRPGAWPRALEWQLSTHHERQERRFLTSLDTHGKSAQQSSKFESQHASFLCASVSPKKLICDITAGAGCNASRQACFFTCHAPNTHPTQPLPKSLSLS